MPNRDWTWPNGQWRMTWRKMWNCNNVEKVETNDETDENIDTMKSSTNIDQPLRWQWLWRWRWSWRWQWSWRWRCCN